MDIDEDEVRDREDRVVIELTFLSGDVHELSVSRRRLDEKGNYGVASLRRRIGEEAASGRLEILRKSLGYADFTRVVCVPHQALAFFDAESNFRPVRATVNVPREPNSVAERTRMRDQARSRSPGEGDHTGSIGDPDVRLSVVVRCFPDLNLRKMLANFLEDDDYYDFIDRVFQRNDPTRSLELPLFDLRGTRERSATRHENDRSEGRSERSSPTCDDTSDVSSLHSPPTGGGAQYEIINGRRIPVSPGTGLHANPVLGLFHHGADDEKELEKRLPTRDDIQIAVFQFATGVFAPDVADGDIPNELSSCPSSGSTRSCASSGARAQRACRVGDGVTHSADAVQDAGYELDLGLPVSEEAPDAPEKTAEAGLARDGVPLLARSTPATSDRAVSDNLVGPDSVGEVMPNSVSREIWAPFRGRFLLTKLSHAMHYHHSTACCRLFFWILTYLLEVLSEFSQWERQ